MLRYPLYIVTYTRGNHWDDESKKKPFHWAFFLQTSRDANENENANENDGKGGGRVYQLHGMPGGFYYSGEEDMKDQPLEAAKKEELQVGSVPVAKYQRFKELLQDVPIRNVESEVWNCQDWSLGVLARLRDEGFVEGDLTDEVVRYWLREDA